MSEVHRLPQFDRLEDLHPHQQQRQPTQAAPLPTVTPGVPEGVMPVQQPTLTTAPVQPQPTDTAPAAQATATVPAAAS